MMVAALAILLAGCQKYDDSELRKEIQGLKTRLDAVESLNTYKDLLAKLNSGTVATGYSVNGNEITLTFADGKSLTFNQKGEPGESITGPAGKTPDFRINEETTTWEVSYDDGETWTEVGSAMDHSLIAGIALAQDGESITISLADGTAIVIPCEDPNAVDMGLSVKWARCNFGASSPEESGYYISWAELEPKSEYTWATYKYCEGVEKTLTKYCKFANYGTPDMIEFLEPEDDAVIQALGGKWRIPTYDEAKALTDTKDNPDYTWELSEVNGQSGYWVTYLVNGNKIFIPASGYQSPDGLQKDNAYGVYWTSRVNFGVDQTGLIFSIITDPNDRNFKYSPGTGYYSRHYGLQIRPVKEY